MRTQFVKYHIFAKRENTKNMRISHYFCQTTYVLSKDGFYFTYLFNSERLVKDVSSIRLTFFKNLYHIMIYLEGRPILQMAL